MLLGHAIIYGLEKLTSLSASNSHHRVLQFSLWGLSCLVELSVQVQIILEDTSQAGRVVIKKKTCQILFLLLICCSTKTKKAAYKQPILGRVYCMHTSQLSLIWRGHPSILFLDRCVDLICVSKTVYLVFLFVFSGQIVFLLAVNIKLYLQILFYY